MTAENGKSAGGRGGAWRKALVSLWLLADPGAFPTAAGETPKARPGGADSARPASAPNPLPEAYFVTENSRRPIVPWSDAGAPGADFLQSHPTSYYWAAFGSVLDEPARQSLDALGLQVLGFAGRPEPYLLYKVRLRDDAGPAARVYASLQGMPFFVNLLPILPEEKMNRAVREGRFRHALPGGKARATLYFHRQADLARAQALLAGKVDRIFAGPPMGCCHVEAAPERLIALASLDEVARVEDYQEQLPLDPAKGAPRAR